MPESIWVENELCVVEPRGRYTCFARVQDAERRPLPAVLIAAKLLGPFDLHRSGTWAGLSTYNDPVNANEIQVAQAD